MHIIINCLCTSHLCKLLVDRLQCGFGLLLRTLLQAQETLLGLIVHVCSGFPLLFQSLDYLLHNVNKSHSLTCWHYKDESKALIRINSPTPDFCVYSKLPPQTIYLSGKLCIMHKVMLILVITADDYFFFCLKNGLEQSSTNQCINTANTLINIECRHNW